MPKEQKETIAWARLIGKGLAHAQDGFDRVTDWGFRQLKEAGKVEIQPKKNQNKYLFGAKKLGKGFIEFVGTTGDEFYKQYGRLKTKRKKG